MKTQLLNKNVLIIVLLGIIMLMGIGFAAFSQRLTITETSGFDSNWNVYISDAVVDRVYGEGDGTANVTARDMATLTTTLKYPGDAVGYLITVKNDGNVDAVLEDINLNVANQDSVIKYLLYDLEKDEIDLTTGIEIPSETEYKFLVIVEYDTNLTGTATEEQKKNSATLDLDFVQKNNEDGSVSMSKTVYRWTGDELYIGDSIEGIDTTTDPSTLGKNYYLKHIVDSNNIIMSSYVCFVTDTEYCMKGGDAAYYQSSVAILQANETWFNNDSGSCYFGNYYSNCNSSSFSVYAKNGNVDVQTGGYRCYVNYYGNGYSGCGITLPE